MNEYVISSTSDGVLTSGEYNTIDTYIKTLETEYADITNSYSSLINNSGVSTSAKQALTNAYNNVTSKYSILINSANAILNCGVTPVGETDDTLPELTTAFVTAYSNFKTNLNTYKGATEAARKSVTDSLNTDIGNLKYLASALKGSTTISGGLVLTNLLQLGNIPQSSQDSITAGINGITYINEGTEQVPI